jgi:hypothetical protein
MQKRSLQAALAAVALVATVLALYVQLFERRSRQAEDRVSAARLEAALAESRAGLKAEILAQLRSELARDGAAGQPGDQPRPDTVLRRGESGGGRALQQEAQGAQAARARSQERLDALALQMEQSDRALRRDLDAMRAEVRREQAVSGKAMGLLLAALIPLVLHFLASLRPPGEAAKPDDAP